MTVTEWPTASCNSRAIRARSAVTARSPSRARRVSVTSSRARPARPASQATPCATAAGTNARSSEASASSAPATGNPASSSARRGGRDRTTRVSARADASDTFVTSAPDTTATTVAPAPAHSAHPGANRRPAIATNHTTAHTRSTTPPSNTDAV
ncbi:hypothetical protein IQ63_26770 [Streptomyces acidiscabies]|uniref:Uncharacterized protein n=2 Tax=Streptomyces acidiscabies TaxID=42234 RepID=A0A0L0JZQ1_9ACTN|nr:hypothetical protein IQ63_26770 [Streptomyces acidiscabies]